MANPNGDVKLTYGVEIGDSKRAILDGLKQILREIDREKELNVTIGVKTGEENKRSLKSQINSMLKEVGKEGTFAIPVSKVTLDSSAKKHLKTMMADVKGISVTVNEVKLSGAARESLRKQIQELVGTQQGTNTGGVQTTVPIVLHGVTREDVETANRVADAQRNAASAAHERAAAELEAAAATRDNAAASNEAAKAIKDEQANNEQVVFTEEARQKALRTTISLLQKARDIERKGSAAQYGTTSVDYSAVQRAIPQLEQLRDRLHDGSISAEEFNQKYSQLNTTVRISESNIRGAGEMTKTWSERIGSLSEKFATWFSITRVIMAVVRGIRQMIKTTIELDDAMTQLEIVTHANEQALTEYGNAISKTASRIGASIKDLIDSTTVYARLGYSLEESSHLAEYTSMLQNVGDIDVADAQDAITAIVKAYGKGVDEIERIMDEMVKVGNNFPISVSQLAEGMNNAGSSLAAAGNSFEQSLALLAAANTTVQNISKASTGLRTIAARIRNTKTELDEMGEAMTEADYENLVNALTKANVALTNVDGSFRSTYDIMSDIAAVWKDLPSNIQAALAETLSGTRQQNIFYSLIEQFGEAQGAMESMKDSAGELRSAYDIFLESITAHINKFKAAFQGLSQTVFEGDFLKRIVDFGTALVNILNSIFKIVDALGGMNTVLYVTASIIATINIGKIINFFPTAISGIAKFITYLIQLPAAFKAVATQGQALGVAFKLVDASADAAAISVASAQVAIGGFLAILGIVLIAVQKHNQAVEEARQKALENARAASEESNNIADLTLRYLDLADAMERNEGDSKSYLSAKNDLIDALGLERNAVNELSGSYRELSEEMIDNSLKKLTTQAIDLAEGVEEAKKALKSAGKSDWTGQNANNIDISYHTNRAQENAAALGAITRAGYSYSMGDMHRFALDGGDEYDLSTVEGVINTYERLGDILAKIRDEVGADNDIYDGLYKQYSKLKEAVEQYTDVVGDANRNIVQTAMIEGLRGKAIASSKEEFEEYRKGVIAAVEADDNFIGSETDVAAAVDGVLRKESRFAGFYEYATDAIQTTIQATKDLSTQLEKLTNLQKHVASLASAYADMAGDDGTVSYSSLTSIAEQFSELDDIDDYISRIAALRDDTDALTGVMNELLGAYIAQKVAAGDLSDADEDVIEAMLREAGVANADEAAHQLLADAKDRVRGEAILAEEGVDGFIESLSDDAAYSGAARSALIQLAAQMVKTNDAKMDFSTQIEKLKELGRQAGLTGALMSLPNLANNREAMHGFSHAGDTETFIDKYISEINAAASKIHFEFDFSGTTSGKGGNSAAKSVDIYTAAIDRFREAIRRLNEATAQRELIEHAIERSDNLRDEIALQDELIAAYEAEQAALHNLNEERDAAIHDETSRLTQLGFNVEYDDVNNKFWVSNLEHINELQGKTTESTNELRKEAEALIGTLDEWNEANAENSATWWTMQEGIVDAKKRIVEAFKEIVVQASEAVDGIQDVYDTLHRAADEYAANGGFITVDSFQAIIALGPQYMQFLRDQNGMLEITDEKVNKIIAAKTEELALEQALTYIERIRLAMQSGSVEDLDNLLYATTEATGATWDLVYANLALLGLDSKQYQAALHNINAIRALADTTVRGIGQTAGSLTDELNAMKSGLDDLLKYVMDMLKQRVEDQIDALEGLKDQYADIIDLKKESIKASKEEADYEKSVAKQVREIASLQARIDALSLDNSRSAQAQRARLLEELADKQAALADEQESHAIEAQEASLDAQLKAYEDEKDKEIRKLEDSISSTEKLYREAIDYISKNWSTLKDDLIQWNYEVGTNFQYEIENAWDAALKAAQRYGNYVTALSNIDADISAASGETHNDSLGGAGNYDVKASNTAGVRAIVDQMKGYSAQWSKDNTSTKNADLHKKVGDLAKMLDNYGVHAEFDGPSGAWIITKDENDKTKVGKHLYQQYHTGGVAGGVGTLREDEIMAKLQKGELIVSNAAKGAVLDAVELIELLRKKVDVSTLPKVRSFDVQSIQRSILGAGSTPASISFGDVIVYGADDKAIDEIRRIKRDQANEVLSYLGIRK